MEDVGRKHPPHQPLRERHNTPIIAFLTVCTKDRKRLLVTDQAYGVLKAAWQTKPSWLIGRYVVMPDHIHLFCSPAEFPARPLIQWVSFWKSLASQH